MRRDFPVLFALSLIAPILSLAAASALAATIFERVGTTGASAFGFDPSLRSMGMGGASGAVTWGVDANYWANPALLGLARGVRYEDGHQKFTWDGDPMFRIRTHRVTLGYGGLGLALAGRPFDGMGGLRTDFGTFMDVNAYEPDAGTTVDIYDQVRSWSLGASLSSLVQSIAAWRGAAAPRWSRWGEIAVGYSQKRDDFFVGDQSFVHTTGRDLGVLASSAATLRGPAGADLRVSGAYGYSVQNFDDAGELGSPAARPHRNALAARAALGLPKSWQRWLPTWLVPDDATLIAFGGAWDVAHVTAGDSDRGAKEAHLWGAEAELAGVFALRFGGQRNASGGAYLPTLGYGLGLPIGRFGGFRYDHARLDQPETILGSFETAHDGWTLWLDPVAIVRARR